MKLIKDIIPENIASLRKEKGLTQSELANLLHYSDKTISKWERGESTPDVDSLYELAKIFDVNVEYFFHENAFDNLGIYNNNNNSLKKSIITCGLIILTIFTIPLIIMIFTNMRDVPFRKDSWICFVWALPFALLYMTFYLRRIKHGLGVIITVSLFIWTLLTAIFLQFLIFDIIFWMVFLIGIPLQLYVCLLYLLKK